MKSRFAHWFQHPESCGLTFGAASIATWKCIPAYIETPAFALLAVTVASVLASTVTAIFRCRSAEPTDRLTRSAAKTGVWAALTTGIVIVLMAWATRGASPFKALLVVGTCLMPAMLCGAVAAGAAVMLGRRRPPEEAPKSLPSASRALTWSCRGVLACGIAAALCAPFFPKPAADAPAQILTAEPPASAPFRYTMPEALKTAPPSAWKVATTRSLGRMQEAPIAFSREQQFLAGLDNPKSLVIHELDTDRVESFPNLPEPVVQVSFSPDAKRLFLVTSPPSNGPLRLAVLERDTKRYIPLPQPKRHAVPHCPVSWIKDELVAFPLKDGPPQGGVWTLNLRSLEFEQDALGEAEIQQARSETSPGLPRNDRWAFDGVKHPVSAETPETQGTVPNWPHELQRTVALRDEKYGTMRIFPDLVSADSSERIVGVNDGSKLIRFRGEQAEAVYFDTRPVPPLRWRIAMPHGPAQLPDAEARQALDSGLLSLMLYAPLINPLTGQTVGPDREQVKAVLRVLDWKDQQAEVWVVFDAHPFAPGDVLADLHVPVGKNTRLLSLETKHRWWTLAPEPPADAADPLKLPLIAELEKRARAAQEKPSENAKPAAPTDPQQPSQPTVKVEVPQPPTEPARDDKPPPSPATIKSANASSAIPPAESPFSRVRADLIPERGSKTAIDTAPLTLTPTEQVEVALSHFIVEHHRKASAGDVQGMAADYAEPSTFFGTPRTTRAMIMAKESAYRKDIAEHEEYVDGLIDFTGVSASGATAEYFLIVRSKNTRGAVTDNRPRIRLKFFKLQDTWWIDTHGPAPKP